MGENEDNKMRNTTDSNHDWMIDSALNQSFDWDYNACNLFTGIDNNLNTIATSQEEEKKKNATLDMINMSNNLKEIDEMDFLDSRWFPLDGRSEVLTGSNQIFKEKIDEISKTILTQETPPQQIGSYDHSIKQKKNTSSFAKNSLVKQNKEKLVHQTTNKKRKRAAYLPQNAQINQFHFDDKNKRSNLAEKQKESIYPTDKDVVFGRGGRANNHIGNINYLRELKKLKATYGNMHKSGKSSVSQMVLDIVHREGGRFLKQEETTGLWYEVPDRLAKKKASQALREAVKRDIRDSKPAVKLTNAKQKKN